MKAANTIRTELVQFLRDRPGDMISAYMIAKKMGLALASTRQTLHELVDAGTIRRSGKHSSVAFYVPSEAMIQAEAKMLAAKSNFQPLKPRPAMAERIAAIRAERNAIRSIY